MQVVLIILSVALLAVIVYFVFSPKSSKLLKLAGVIALGLIGLSVIVSGIVLIVGPGEAKTEIPLPAFDEVQTEAKKSNVTGVLVFLAILLLILGLIILVALRGTGNKGGVPKKVEKDPVRTDEREPRFEYGNEEFEDSFDIE